MDIDANAASISQANCDFNASTSTVATGIEFHSVSNFNNSGARDIKGTVTIELIVYLSHTHSDPGFDITLEINGYDTVVTLYEPSYVEVTKVS